MHYTRTRCSSRPSTIRLRQPPAGKHKVAPGTRPQWKTPAPAGRMPLHDLGIDVLQRLVAAPLITPPDARQRRRFTNYPKGFDQLQRWLARLAATTVHAGMDATHVYWEALARSWSTSSTR
ncbi:MAG: hypothetical protein MI924_20965 [Chloroflexales bacterium]|nr:hypothetical protein [Chloroflexales bacterium]